MSPKYKNDLAKCFAVLKFDHNWKSACEDLSTFRRVLSDLTTELVKADNAIHPVSTEGDQDKLYCSIEAFLTAYGCPYSVLTKLPLDERFGTLDNRMLLLRYLCTELIAKRRLDSAASLDSSQASHVSQLTTTNLDKELSACIVLACTSLGIPSPAPGFDISTTFDAINNATIKALKRCPSTYFGQPVLPLTGLSDRQWGQVARISGLLQQEYAVRHATMLKRLNVTVQSFKWSDKAKRNLEAIAAAYQPIYSELTKPVFPGIPELLAVRDNMILRIEKTSGLHARRFTTCTLNKILIGQVPDRGGRAWELEPPPPEMPAFKQRQPDQGRGGASFGGGRGGGGGGGGGFGSDRGRGGSVRGVQQQFRPPAPSAQCGGGDYVVSQPAYLALNQQMHGLTFERGMGISHPQGYVFQPGNIQDTASYYCRPPRGGGGQRRGYPP